MNQKMMMPFLVLAVLLVLVIGCNVPEQSISIAPAEQTAEEAEVAGELNELDELEELEGELDDLEWQEMEGAVR